jgi:toxin-antitoxin system PIN domain toxin
MSVLLDSNVLISMVDPDHVHHERATDWFSQRHEPFATCPITQGSLVRFLIRTGQSAAAARDVVAAVEGAKRHEFWPDSQSFAEVNIAGVVGHRQATDAYLCHLARGRNGQVATFDRGLAAVHLDVAVLVPSNG